VTEADRTLYVLSKADSARIFRERIAPNDLAGTPQDQPLAIIVSGQTGAGKWGCPARPARCRPRQPAQPQVEGERSRGRGCRLDAAPTFEERLERLVTQALAGSGEGRTGGQALDEADPSSPSLALRRRREPRALSGPRALRG
jgi:hypothetical protein